jgi:hypothetical protein
MASYHLSVKIGKNSSGAKHAAYISREGKYADKEDCEAVLNENMPDWAKEPNDFWQAADQCERANGSIYREFEIALPRELTPDQRLALVKEFIAIEIGNKFTYTAAIHNPRAAIEGGEQPHAHIMYSERTLDGIERPAEQHFKRYNAKNPERGGCQKANTAKTKDERKTELVSLRERWADLQNKHIERAGYSTKVNHRSLADQGIARLPEAHIGPKRRELFPLVKAARVQVQTQKTAVKPALDMAEIRARAAASKEAIKNQMAQRQQAENRASIERYKAADNERKAEQAKLAAQQEAKQLEARRAAAERERLKPPDRGMSR